MCSEKVKHDHGVGIFSKTHSCIEKELMNQNIRIQDDDNLIEKKRVYEENPTNENLIQLGGAYSFQLRYKEALEIYNKALLEKETYNARRKRAITYLKLLMFDDAYNEFMWCKEYSNDLLDINYRLGLAKYYNGEYEIAKNHFIDCFPLALDNPDMYVSALYWLHLCLLRLDMPMDLFYKYRHNYKNNFYTHPGYDLYIRFVCNEIDLDEFEYQADTFSFLQQTCCYYGMSVYFEKKNKEKSRQYLISTLSYKDYFGGFAYIAAYSDKIRAND